VSAAREVSRSVGSRRDVLREPYALHAVQHSASPAPDGAARAESK
jgi:hypothetical protein